MSNIYMIISIFLVILWLLLKYILDATDKLQSNY